MNVLPPCVPCAKEVRKTGGTDDYESSCEHWELNSVPLQEHPVLFLTEHLYLIFNKFCITFKALN